MAMSPHLKKTTGPTPPAGPPRHLRTMRDMLPLLWPSDRADLRYRVIFSLLMLLAAKAVTVYAPVLYGRATDLLSPQDSMAVVVVPLLLLLSYGVARILMVALAQLRDGVFAPVGQHAVRALALQTFRHLHNLSLRFHLERRTGGLSRIIERGTKGVEFLLRFSLFSIFPTIIELALVCGIFAYLFGASYALVTLVMVVLYTWFTFSLTEWRTRIRREMNDLDTDANSKAVDSLLNFETVKYFGSEEREASRFDRTMAGYERAAVKTTTSLSWLNTGQTVIFTLGMTLLMLMAARDIAEGRMTIGGFVMVNAYLIQLYQPLNLLGTVYREIRQALIDMENMFHLLDVKADIVDKPGAPDLSVRGGEVSFENVDFSYEDGRKVLDDVSFHVPAGKMLAVVGPSGAGKSTISRLLFRFYDVQRGRILIDGQDISTITQKSLRDSIGMVPQDTVLFNDTIHYNLRYGNPDASDADIERAAEDASIADFIKTLPKGFDAMVGERGLKLSGGEKQRVAIARTILKDPAILVLDEATSALDSHTEKDIQASLRRIAENRTTLVIAHRLSTIVDADEIVVLKSGRIAERGSHEALLRMNGVYASMWNRQREADAARRKLEETEESALQEADYA